MTSLIKMTVENLTMYQQYALKAADSKSLKDSLDSLYSQINTHNYKLDLNEALLLNNLHEKVCRELKIETYMTFDLFIKKNSFFN